MRSLILLIYANKTVILAARNGWWGLPKFEVAADERPADTARRMLNQFFQKIDIDEISFKLVQLRAESRSETWNERHLTIVRLSGQMHAVSACGYNCPAWYDLTKLPEKLLDGDRAVIRKYK